LRQCGAPAGAGRFAPSPTGPLHLGSLLAATASYLDARIQGVAWQVRLDDLDAPRNQPGAEHEILRALERHGLHWDGAVVRQSERLDRYRAALARLDARRLLFYCVCSRKDLEGHALYPGTCREHRRARPSAAARVRVGDALIEFDDLILGPQRDRLAATTGDFIVQRRDGLVAYQLATAVDDGDPAITRVIRGRDLLENTARQIFLMQHLGLEVPAYGHIPLIVNAAGQKLSKQTGAHPLDLARPASNLALVLDVLGVPAEVTGAGSRGRSGTASSSQAACEALLAAALPGWSLDRIGRTDVTAVS
jgi:glutamyl-Q tRNA(Asp) synthetase